MASGTGSQTALQAWQVALFAQIDAAANSLDAVEFTTLAVIVGKRLEDRAWVVHRDRPVERVNGEVRRVMMGDALVAAAPGWRLCCWKLPDSPHYADLTAGDIDRAPASALVYTRPIACWVLQYTDDGCDTPYLVAATPEDFPQYMSVEPEDHPFRLAYLGPGEDVDDEIVAEARRQALEWLEARQGRS